MLNINETILKGEKVKLVPLTIEHHDQLIEAVNDGKLWELWNTLIPEPSVMKHEISRRLELKAKGEMIPFTVIDTKTNNIIGMTAFLNIDQINKRVEIGVTWLSKSFQGSGVNTEAKYLMLQNAFESMDCIVVEIRTHFLNHQSRKAIEKLGAKLDGILRNNMIMPNGSLRDTCVYSIIKSEWPTIKKHLLYQLKIST